MPAPARITLPVPSPWQAHVRTWAGCERCHLSACRTEIVLFRGSLPCDVLFVGEAPGKTEDALGEPFKGPAGQLLDRIVETAADGLPSPPTPIRLGFTNLIACIPLEEDGSKMEDGPPDEAVTACAPRLADLVRMAAPRLLVRVGKHSQHWLAAGMRHSVKVPFVGPVCDLSHPAWMLRKPEAFRDLEAHRAAVTLRKAVAEALFDGGGRAVNLSDGRSDHPHLPDNPEDEIPF